jgi:phage-related minor tail protein
MNNSSPFVSSLLIAGTAVAGIAIGWYQSTQVLAQRTNEAKTEAIKTCIAMGTYSFTETKENNGVTTVTTISEPTGKFQECLELTGIEK